WGGAGRWWGEEVRGVGGDNYRAVGPYLRGYPPSEIPREGFYDKGTLVADIAALIRALGEGAPAHIVGQDWGASITYNLLAALPELVHRAVVMAGPPPAPTAESVPDAPHRPPAFSLGFFPLPPPPPPALAPDHLPFLDNL